MYGILRLPDVYYVHGITNVGSYPLYMNSYLCLKLRPLDSLFEFCFCCTDTIVVQGDGERTQQ